VSFLFLPHAALGHGDGRQRRGKATQQLCSTGRRFREIYQDYLIRMSKNDPLLVTFEAATSWSHDR